MVIGIDGNEANTNAKVGVHQMAYEMLWGLFKLQDAKSTNTEYWIYLKNEPGKHLPPERNNWKYKILPGGRIWILTRLMPSLWKTPRPDIFFTPTHYLPPFLPMPGVCSITDLGYLVFSGQFKPYDYWQLRLWTAISLYVSKYIISISNSTSEDIVKNYPFTTNKVKTIYLGPNSLDFSDKSAKTAPQKILKHYRITKPYVLFISTLKPSKNIEGLVEAFAKVKTRSSYQLVIAGKKGWLYDSIFERVQKLGLTESVIFTDYLPEEHKPVLLKNAKVFTAPSYWEGFGIDILNAYAAGVPAVVSKVASIPEVAGEAGIYVDPTDIKSITAGIDRVLAMNKKEYNYQVELGYKQLEKFSWEKCSKELFEVLNEAGKTS
jgi:glycosyltransferase involved in cell wall biosynthesis